MTEPEEKMTPGEQDLQQGTEELTETELTTMEVAWVCTSSPACILEIFNELLIVGVRVSQSFPASGTIFLLLSSLVYT